LGQWEPLLQSRQVLPQDGHLEVAQRRSRLEAELLPQHRLGAPQRLKGVRLAPGSDEGESLQPPQLLVQRVGLEDGPEVGRHRGGPSET